MNQNPKWTGLLIRCAEMKEGESLTLEIREAEINRFRAIIRVSGRTSQWRWSVKQSEAKGVWSVKKVEKWN